MSHMTKFGLCPKSKTNGLQTQQKFSYTLCSTCPPCHNNITSKDDFLFKQALWLCVQCWLVNRVLKVKVEVQGYVIGALLWFHKNCFFSPWKWLDYDETQLCDTLVNEDVFRIGISDPLCGCHLEAESVEYFLLRYQKYKNAREVMSHMTKFGLCPKSKTNGLQTQQKFSY